MWDHVPLRFSRPSVRSYVMRTSELLTGFFLGARAGRSSPWRSCGQVEGTGGGLETGFDRFCDGAVDIHDILAGAVGLDGEGFEAGLGVRVIVAVGG